MLTIRLLTCATDPAGAPADRAAAAVSGPPWAPIQRPAAPRRARRALPLAPSAAPPGQRRRAERPSAKKRVIFPMTLLMH